MLLYERYWRSLVPILHHLANMYFNFDAFCLLVFTLTGVVTCFQCDTMHHVKKQCGPTDFGGSQYCCQT